MNIQSTKATRAPVLWILFFAIAFYCLDYYFRTSPSLVVTQLMAQYHIGTLGIAGFASAFYLGYVVFQIPAGLLLDRYSLHQVLVPAILICTLGSIAFLFAHSYITGYLLSLITGFASSFSFIAVLFIARLYIADKWFTFIAGITVAAGTLVSSLAGMSSAFLLRHINWQVVLVWFSAWGVFIAIAIFLLRKSTRTILFRRQSLSEKRNLEGSFKKTLSYFFSNRTLMLNSLIGGLFYLPTIIIASLWGIPFLKNAYQLSPVEASLGITCLFLGWAIGAPLIGLFADRIKKPAKLISYGAFFGLWFSLPLIYGAQWLNQSVFILLFIFGLCSSTQIVIWKVFNDECSKSIAGAGIALTNMLIMAFGAVFHLVVGWLLNSEWFSHVGGKIDYSVGLGVIPIAFFVVFCLSFLLKTKAKA